MKQSYEFAGQEKIFSPQLIYYKDIIEENVEKTKAIAGGPERLWPHVKTHKMADMVKLMQEHGIHKCKCATIAEAQMCAREGVSKVVLAYPLVGPNISRFLTLQENYPETEFYAVFDCTEQVEEAGYQAVEKGCRIRSLMDVDTGQHRTGVELEDIVDQYRRWDKINGIWMQGLHCYDGHRHEKELALRTQNAQKTDNMIKDCQDRLEKEGMDCKILIFGGTPSFPCHAALTSDYLSPGTCLIQDAGYQKEFPDLDFVPGAAILTRVVSRQGKDCFTVDMGTKAVASDPSPERAVIVGMEYAKTVLQNEEHWVVRVPQEHIKDIPEVGSVLFAIPIHICPTTALYPEVPVVSGGHIEAWWEVTARNRKLTI